jgi:protein-S-isoprenylcysteine O-methyltransferase Ste14
MHALELKVPPPLVALVVALLMWLVSRLMPPPDVSLAWRLAAALLPAGAGVVLRGAAQLAFVRARTTINPMQPQASASIVSSGVYRFTRNPMYLGRTLQLLGWGAFLADAGALLLVPLYVLYIDRFQVRPEERALAGQFGEAYLAYTRRVRRWL